MNLLSLPIRLFGPRRPRQDPTSFPLRTRRQRPEYSRWDTMSLREWLLHHQKELVFDKCSWMGVLAWKNPFDAWIYQEIIYETKPAVIIEIGSAMGGSTLYLAHLLDLIGRGAVISIDIDRTKYSVEHPRITTLTGDSADEGIVAAVAELCSGKSAMVIHDGDHRKAHVLKDLHAYAQFVSPNHYLIVEDGIMDVCEPGDGIGDYEDGPLTALEEFLGQNDDFVVDTSRERYILTYNPKGFLRRV